MNRLSYFRIFIPSWRFFESTGDLALLQYRMHMPNQRVTGWQDCLSKPSASFLSFFINPQGNFYLAAQTLVEQTLVNLNDDSFRLNFSQSSTYQMLQALVRAQICQHQDLAPVSYQFKITVQSATAQDGTVEDAVISQEHQI